MLTNGLTTCFVAKSLIFSRFGSKLQWLQEALPQHGFQYRKLSGDKSMKQRAKALRDFQHDPPTTGFLLSMRAGAVGSNLTQANHVFLMEPSLNPALEAQAMGRVVRLGQKRPVTVYRLVVEDSIDSRTREVLAQKLGDDDKMIGGIAREKADMVEKELDIILKV